MKLFYRITGVSNHVDSLEFGSFSAAENYLYDLGQVDEDLTCDAWVVLVAEKNGIQKKLATFDYDGCIEDFDLGLDLFGEFVPESVSVRIDPVNLDDRNIWKASPWL
jgi:hypothetical protein